MNPEIKAKWVEALRSGKYKQGTGKLRNGDNEFCCLGVLCDLAEREGIVTAERDDDWIEDWYYDGTDTDLPLSVMNWADLDERNPMLGVDSCIALNDEMGKPFTFIADEIEKAL